MKCVKMHSLYPHPHNVAPLDSNVCVFCAIWVQIAIMLPGTNFVKYFEVSINVFQEIADKRIT